MSSIRPLYLAFFFSALAASDAAWSASPAPVETTSEFESLSPEDLLEAIEKAEDFFGWNKLRETVLRWGLKNPEIAKAMASSEARLRREFPPQPVDENLELLAFGWTYHRSLEDGLARFRVEWLFHLSRKIELEEGVSLRLIVDARPKVDHAHLLALDRERETGIAQGTLRVGSFPSGWESDSYPSFEMQVTAPPIPYRISTYFVAKRGEKILGNWGRKIDLGWLVDLPF